MADIPISGDGILLIDLGLVLRMGSPADSLGGREAQMKAAQSLTSRDKRLDAVNLGCVSSAVQVMHLLKVQPEIGGCAECSPDAQRCIGRDCATAMNDFINAARRHVDRFCQAVLTDFQLLKKFRQVLAGMNGIDVGHGMPQ